MIQAFSTYIKNIAMFFIFTALIEMILPNGKFKKYISLVTGLLMIIIVLNPLGLLFNGKRQTFTGILYDNEVLMNKHLIEQEKNIYEEKQNGLIIKTYEESLADQLLKKLFGQFNVTGDISVSVYTEDSRFGEIKAVYATLYEEETAIGAIEKIKIKTGASSGDAEENGNGEKENLVKNFIKDFYNLPVNNIYITVQKK